MGKETPLSAHQELLLFFSQGLKEHVPYCTWTFLLQIATWACTKYEMLCNIMETRKTSSNSGKEKFQQNKCLLLMIYSNKIKKKNSFKNLCHLRESWLDFSERQRIAPHFCNRGVTILIYFFQACEVSR